MAYVNTLGMTSKFPIVTIFVTVKIQTTVHTQPVHVDVTHFRTKFHTHSSSCPVVTVSCVPRNFFGGGVQLIQLRTERTGIWVWQPHSQGFWRQL
jgi:hypothetical protein